MGVYNENLYRVLGMMITDIFYLVQDMYLTQHMLEPTRGENVSQPYIFYHQSKRTESKNTVPEIFSHRKI